MIPDFRPIARCLANLTSSLGPAPNAWTSGTLERASEAMELAAAKEAADLDVNFLMKWLQRPVMIR